MDRYNTKNQCPKCNALAETKFTNDGYIRRTCIRCGYFWHEKPLDAE